MNVFTKMRTFLLKISMDDDDEENQKYDKGKKYWIPGLKIIGKFF